MSSITRGSVWWIEMPIKPNSHVQGGGRPYVVISEVLLNSASGVVTVCPMSTKIDKFASHAKVKFKRDAQVLCDQITTVDVSELTEYNGQLSDYDMQKVEESLAYYLGITLKSKNSDNSITGDLETRLHNLEIEVFKIKHKFSTAIRPM